MKQMKRLINKKIIIKRTLQSLPAVLVAIALVMYALSFTPQSIERMERSAALLECSSWYEITSNGKPVAYFKALNDSMRPEEVSVKLDSAVVTKQYIEGVFVNRYPLISSCRGRIVTTLPVVSDMKRLAGITADKTKLLKESALNIEKEMKRMDREIEETDYFLKTHNVSDGGYNAVAAYSAQMKARRETAEATLSVLKTIEKKGRLNFELKYKYTLLYKDTTGVRRIETNVLPVADKYSPMKMIQTADKKLPDGVVAQYLHRWFVPEVEPGEPVIVASHPGSMMIGFVPGATAAKTFGGTATARQQHKMPLTIAPNGAAVYSDRGFFLGINYDKKIVKPVNLGFK